MISVGVPTYNGADDLLQWCLGSIRSRSGDTSRYEIIVVDDSGNNEHRAKSRAVAQSFGARWLAHDQNRGIAAGWNTLTRAAISSKVVLLNDDIVVAPHWIETTEYFLDHNPHAGTCGLHFYFITREDVPRLVNDVSAVIPARDPFTKEPKPHDHNSHGTPGVVMCPPGSCFGFTREKFELVGGFDEAYLSMYEESLPGYEQVLVRDNNTVRLTTFEALYNDLDHTAEHIDGKSVVRPIGLECLSAVVTRDQSVAFLTVREQNVMETGATDPKSYLVLRRANKKQNEAERVDGVWKPVTAIVRHKRHNRVVHVRQKAGSVYVTENHSMVVPDGDGFRVVAPRVFTESDLPKAITVPLRETCRRLDLGAYLRGWDQYREDDTQIWYLRKNNQSAISENMPSPKLPRWIDLDSPSGVDFCWLLGFHVAEGSTCISYTNHMQIVTTLASNSDTSLIEKARAIWLKVMGTEPFVVTIAKDSSEYKQVYNLNVCHKLVGLMLRAMCGVGARNKRVPDFVYNAPRACKEAFMAGYAAGDGLEIPSESDREESRSTLHVETVSRALASGLAVLFANLERRFSLQYRPKFDSYAIRTVQQFIGHRDTKVVECLETDESEYVYDFTVTDGHVFCAGVGPVVVHNSDFGTALAAKGYASYCIPYPSLGHIWSATFAKAPELNAGLRMVQSRARYIEKWDGHFEVTNPRFMARCTPQLTRWLGPDGPKEAII